LPRRQRIWYSRDYGLKMILRHRTIEIYQYPILVLAIRQWK